MFYVYFILLDDGNIYKGYCSNLKQRWQDHFRKKVKSTKRYDNLNLIGYEAYLLKSDAQRREKFLKTTEGRRLLNQQYRDVIKKFKN